MTNSECSQKTCTCIPIRRQHFAFALKILTLGEDTWTANIARW